MKNKKIGETLKKYRKLNGYQVHDVAKILREKYQLDIAEKTIYGWESNQSHPTTDTFLVICEIYQISDISELFLSNEIENSNFTILSEERTLVEAYRNQPKLQTSIKRILEMEKPE